MARKKAWQQLLKLHAMHRVGMLRGSVGDAVLDKLAGKCTGIGKRPAVQQQQNARPQQLQQNSVEQSSQNAPPASLLSFAYAALVRCSAV